VLFWFSWPPIKLLNTYLRGLQGKATDLHILQLYVVFIICTCAIFLKNIVAKKSFYFYNGPYNNDGKYNLYTFYYTSIHNNTVLKLFNYSIIVLVKIRKRNFLFSLFCFSKLLLKVK
jgi:hypothetical protein